MWVAGVDDGIVWAEKSRVWVAGVDDGPSKSSCGAEKEFSWTRMVHSPLDLGDTWMRENLVSMIVLRRRTKGKQEIATYVCFSHFRQRS